jgi:hypothetical protein
MGTNIRNDISSKNPYYLTKHEYLMCRHFALQYPEWKARKREIESRVSYGFKIDMIQESHVDTTVEILYDLAKTYSSRIDMIEQVAKIAGEDIWEFVLLGVTTERSYECLRTTYGIPCCKDVYYRMYRKFYWLLNRQICKLFNGRPDYIL